MSSTILFLILSLITFNLSFKSKISLPRFSKSDAFMKCIIQAVEANRFTIDFYFWTKQLNTEKQLPCSRSSNHKLWFLPLYESLLSTRICTLPCHIIIILSFDMYRFRIQSPYSYVCSCIRQTARFIVFGSRLRKYGIFQTNCIRWTISSSLQFFILS